MLGALEPSKLTLRGLAIVRDGRVGSAKLGTMNYHDYLKTDYWKAVSQAVKKRAGYRCQICNSQHDLQAHHRCYDHRGNELNHLDDLTCLCRRCHAIFHGQMPQVAPAPVKEKPQKPARPHGEVDEAWVEIHMPPGKMITLNRQLIIQCRTEANGFTNATLRALGMKPPLVAGWVRRLQGNTMTAAAYREALRGRFIYNSGKLE